MRGVMKEINRAIGRNMLFMFRWITRRIPYAVYKMCAIVFIPIITCVMMAKYKLVMDSLAIAYENEKSIKERRKIAWGCFRNCAVSMLDLIYFLDHREDMRRRINIEGREHLDAALAGGKGVVILSAHFGNFISMFLRLLQEGYKVNVVTRKTRDNHFERYITDLRRSNGLKTIYADPGRESIGQALKVLRSNEILVILLDQNYGRRGGVFVDFFGKKAATATGPLIFSSRSESPIIPMFLVDQGNGKQKIIIEPPVEMLKDKTKVSLVKNISRLTQVIERYIRKYPDQWGGWMHQRWKTRYRGTSISA